MRNLTRSGPRMTWFKVDDSFHSHPKVLAADAAALGLWVVAGAWCSANLTDGFVPDYAIPRLLPDAAQLADKLVTCRLWKRTKGGYQFHDWGDYNPNSSDVQKERDAARERMRNLRAKRKGAGQPGKRSPEQPANVRENFAGSSQPRPDPTRSTTNGPYVPQGRTARAREAPPSDEPPTRVETLIAEYRDNSPRGVPARQAERLAAEIHQLIADGYTDLEIRAGLGQLRPRKLGPAMLAALVDELANAPAPSNVVALRGDRSGDRPSVSDQRVGKGLDLADHYDRLDAEGAMT